MRGTLEVGDALVAGAHWGRVRAMHDFLGNRVGQALPGEPVEVLGFEGVPEAGERVRVVDTSAAREQLAGETRQPAQDRIARAPQRQADLAREHLRVATCRSSTWCSSPMSPGSLEAIEDEIAKLPQDEVSVNVIRRAVGAVTESDVMLAAASDAVILAFNVRPVGDARAVAEREGVEIRSYSVIYRAIEELRRRCRACSHPRRSRTRSAAPRCARSSAPRASARSRARTCSTGKITRGGKVRLVRDGTVVYDGEIASLRRVNEDVREVLAGFDCGVVLKDYADVKEGDVLEAYATRQVERELG